jgi:hypothetical protein
MERYSLLQVLTTLQSVFQLLLHRTAVGFPSPKSKELLSEGEKNGLEKEECSVYKMCFGYLLKWTVSFNEFNYFRWMNLNDALSISNAHSTRKKNLRD